MERVHTSTLCTHIFKLPSTPWKSASSPRELLPFFIHSKQKKGRCLRLAFLTLTIASSTQLWGTVQCVRKPTSIQQLHRQKTTKIWFVKKMKRKQPSCISFWKHVKSASSHKRAWTRLKDYNFLKDDLCKHNGQLGNQTLLKVWSSQDKFLHCKAVVIILWTFKWSIGRESLFPIWHPALSIVIRCPHSLGKQQQELRYLGKPGSALVIPILNTSTQT